ncbi:hypothetical protein ACFPRL_24980 [Pseudoclavibacter helvolus]
MALRFARETRRPRAAAIPPTHVNASLAAMAATSAVSRCSEARNFASTSSSWMVVIGRPSARCCWRAAPK